MNPAITSVGACADPAMPFIRLAVDPAYIWPWLRSLLGDTNDGLSLDEIRIVRWKRGRRCLIEYDVGHAGDGGSRRTLVGKIRAKSLDESAFNLARRLSTRGLTHDSPDGVSIPPVLGTIPECHMWLQEKVHGVPGWQAIAADGGSDAAAAIGRALAKFQQALPELSRNHSIRDEIAHLRLTLEMARARHPEWASRLTRVERACIRLAASVPQSPLSGSHRDFYHDQVIVGPDRIWLLDLDLVARADPAVDAGNFTAHLAEQSGRVMGDVSALAREASDFIAGYLEAGGRANRRAIETYETLSLVRHIYLSTTFEERRAFTEALLTLCEHRLQL